MKNHRILILLCAVGLAACSKDAVQVDEITTPVTGLAFIKFFHFGVGGPGVNFYANTQKLTGVTSTTGVESTTGTTYSGAAPAAGVQYVGLPAGQYTFSGRIAAAVDKDLPISSVPVTLVEGKRYSYYLSGIYNTTTKTTEAFVIEDNLPAFEFASIDFTKACVRFVNAISNSQPMALYIKGSTTLPEIKIGSEVAYKSATPFVCVDPLVYDGFVRTAGSATNVITRTAMSLVAGRIYTVAARGDITVTGTTATNRPLLDLTANR